MSKLIIQHSTLSDYTKAFNNLSDQAQETEFENIGGLWAKQSAKYGPVVYSSNIVGSIPRNKQKDFGIIGLGGKGADWWADTPHGPVAIEVKFQHNEAKSLMMKKFGDKDKFLQSTNAIEKVMITNVSAVSRNVQEYASDWIIISGDMVFNPTAYKQMRDVALAEENQQIILLKKPDIVSYRISEVGHDKGTDTFHRVSMKDGHIDVVSQIKKYGNARSIWNKPTAAGKGFDPILYWNNYFKPWLMSTTPKKKFLSHAQ
tara:strand:- start:805 stop:1581 length:777 start_codon:yes stop_codon:yes gene_type:complete